MRQQTIDRPLADRQPCLPAQRSLHGVSIQLLVALDAEGSHRRAFTRIDEAELDAGLISVPRHLPTQRIDFLYQMSLGDSPDRRVARHLRDAVAIHCEQQGSRTHARRGQGGFTAGMASTHYNDVNRLFHVQPVSICRYRILKRSDQESRPS
jgi:hypothetical protein